MLSLTRKTDYALVALTCLARLAPQKASARQISERFQVPLPMLMNILKDLMNRGLISSTRGVNGGYCLTRDPREITLADIIEALEGPVKLAMCCNDDDHDEVLECDLHASCPTRGSIQKVHHLFRGFLEQVSLADLVSNQVPVTIGKNGAAIHYRSRPQPVSASHNGMAVPAIQTQE